MQKIKYGFAMLALLLMGAFFYPGMVQAQDVAQDSGEIEISGTAAELLITGDNTDGLVVSGGSIIVGAAHADNYTVTAIYPDGNTEDYPLTVTAVPDRIAVYDNGVEIDEVISSSSRPTATFSLIARLFDKAGDEIPTALTWTDGGFSDEITVTEGSVRYSTARYAKECFTIRSDEYDIERTLNAIKKSYTRYDITIEAGKYAEYELDPEFIGIRETEQPLLIVSDKLVMNNSRTSDGYLRNLTADEESRYITASLDELTLTISAGQVKSDYEYAKVYIGRNDDGHITDNVYCVFWVRVIESPEPDPESGEDPEQPSDPEEEPEQEPIPEPEPPQDPEPSSEPDDPKPAPEPEPSDDIASFYKANRVVDEQTGTVTETISMGLTEIRRITQKNGDYAESVIVKSVDGTIIERCTLSRTSVGGIVTVNNSYTDSRGVETVLEEQKDASGIGYTLRRVTDGESVTECCIEKVTGGKIARIKTVEATAEDYLKATYQIDGTATLTALDTNRSTVVIGGIIEGYSVTQVGDGAVKGNKGLRSVELRGVMEIGADAFRKTGLRRVYVDSYLRKVGNGAFKGTKKVVYSLEGTKRERRMMKKLIKKGGGKGSFRKW